MTEDHSTQRRVVALLLLVAALGGLGAVALGAAAERGPISVLAGPPASVDASPPTAAPETLEEPDRGTLDVPSSPPRPDLGRAPLIVLLSLLGAALVVLAGWIALRMRALAQPVPTEAGDAAEDELTADRARAALDEARDPLSSLVDAQDAVIAAWLVLERSLAEAGVPRHPSRTTLEFVVEVLAVFDLDRSALDRLAGLYRRALFDPAPLGEDDRTAAVAALDRLRADLDGLDTSAPRDPAAAPAGGGGQGVDGSGRGTGGGRRGVDGSGRP